MLVWLVGRISCPQDDTASDHADGAMLCVGRRGTEVLRHIRGRQSGEFSELFILFLIIKYQKY